MGACGSYDVPGSRERRTVTEAAAGANGIAEDVTQVATAAADTREDAHSTLASATELTGMAGELRDLVGRFTL